MKKYLWILLAVCVICIGALAVSSFADATTAVYVDQANGSNDAAGTKEEPVNSMEKAFELLPEGGTIYVVGTYSISSYDSKQVVVFPETEGEVLITSADKDALSTIAFECAKKTYVQFKSPVAFDYINWTYNHANVSGKGAMDIYSGPSLAYGENFTFTCANEANCPGKPIHENCVSIRGGWYDENYKGTIYTGSDVELTVLGGKWAYINGGSGNGTVAVTNAEITFGGNAEIYQRLQVAGSNGGDVTGDAVVNVTGGKIGTGGSETNADTVADYGLFFIGHGKNTNTTEVGNLTVNISGGYINVIKTARTSYEVLKGNLTVNISGNPTINNVALDTSKIDLEKSQILNIDIDGMTGDMFVDTNNSNDFWDEINLFEPTVLKSIDRFNGVAAPVSDLFYVQGTTSDITLLGWAITDAGLSNIKYVIDDGEAIELLPTRPRGDVLNAIHYAGPDLVNPDKVGFGKDEEHAKIDISALEIGEHVVTVYAYSNAGTAAEICSFNVTILEPLAEGEVISLSGINAPGEYKLVADVTGNLNLSSGDYVIDLNGHTWTNSGIALNVTGANVTIIDSVGDGYIMSTGVDCIDISSGSITLTGATAIATADGMDAIFVGGGTVVTNDATLYGGKSGINAANAGVDITVNGGTFGGVYSGEYFARTAAFELRNNATVKLNGAIVFECPTIIRRANHTNYWEDTFILGEGATAFYDFDDVDIGVHGGNQYYSNYIYYSYSVPAVVGLTPHSGHYGSPSLWLQSPDHFYEMIINAQGDFNAIISSVWASNDGTTCTLDIYAWNSDRETTLAGEPVVSLTESFTGNPSNYVFDLGDTLWSGQYIVVVRCTEGYLVLPVATETANGAEIAVNTVNSQNVTGKYWVASVNFVDENYATFGELLEDAGSSEENPYFIWDITGTATVKPGATYYVAGYWGGMEIEVTGEGDFVVVYNATTLNPENGVVSFTAEPGMGRMPVIFAIVNNTNAAAEYSIVATHPTGSYMNPEEYDPAEETTNTVDLPEGSFDGYYFSFIATEDGSITLYIDSITDGAEGDIIVTATDAEYISVMKSLSEDGVDGKVTIDYKAGDEVIINVFAQADDNWNIPAATITIGQYVESSDTGDFGLIALAFVAISSVVLKKKKEY